MPWASRSSHAPRAWLTAAGWWLASLGCLAGCAQVQPWQMRDLSRPCMQSPFGATALQAQYEDKLVQTQTAGGLPGEAPGGGCGCVQ